MDADTRHQLKQNEFAEALARIRDFSDKRTLAWLGVIVVIALAYAGYRYWRWRQQADVKQAYTALAGVRSAVSDASKGDAPLATLRRIISENEQPELVAWARLQLGEGLQARGQAADGTNLLDEAEQEYQTVLEMPVAADLFKAPALYRLGLLNETKRDFAKARQMFTELRDDPRCAGSPFVDQANARLEELDKLEVPVVFQPGVKPLPTTQEATAATTQPQAPAAPGATTETPPAPASHPVTGEAPAAAPPPSTTRPQQP